VTTKPSFFETPRGIWTLVAVLGTLVGVLAFWVGYDLGRHPAQPIQIIFQPGSIVVPK
jgi:hypothetical protein